MEDDLVKVKLKEDYHSEKYVGLCGFYISKGEIKNCPTDVYSAGKNALELAEEETVKVEPELEEDSGIITAYSDVDSEPEPEEPKVAKRGKKKGKKY